MIRGLGPRTLVPLVLVGGTALLLLAGGKPGFVGGDPGPGSHDGVDPASRDAEATPPGDGEAGSWKGAPALRGFNFTHEGYRGRGGGYLSDEARSSLERLRATGANSVAIVPYTFVRDPRSPAPFPVPGDGRGESDRAVGHAVDAAHALGLSVLLKPQIWVRGGWTGDISMGSAADWDLFFRYYEEWIGHYARLSSRHGVELLAVGVELPGATLGHEDRWVAMAGRLREVYPGPLVYAANWYGEFEELSFWHAFDFIGVDAYYPVSDRRNASDADLARGARSVVRRIEEIQRRFGRPVVVTEIGFGSTEAPWISPHASDRGGPPSAVDQARSYAAIVSALDGRPWLHGVYWWKWPSHGAPAAPDDRGFSPVGKPAEVVVTRWFGGPGGASAHGMEGSRSRSLPSDSPPR